MSNSKKYLALAITAFKAKHFEEAGVLFAQASEEADSDLLKLLSVDEKVVSESTDQQDEEVTEKETSDEQVGETTDIEDDDWGDKEVEASESSVIRRKTSSLHQIGKILAASMEAVCSDDSEESDEETEDFDSEDFEDVDKIPEPDYDLPGEELVPVSFSSVGVKGTINSPIRLKV